MPHDAPATAPRARGAGSRGTYRKTEARQDAILDAALQVFARSGFRAGSLRETAQLIGMSEAGLLHHFPNKSVLLARVLERRDEITQAQQTDIRDGAALLAGYVRLAERNAREPGVVRLFTTLSAEATSPDHPAHAYFVGRYESVRRTLWRGFDDLRSRDLLAPGVAPAIATVSTLAIWDGLQVQWLLDPTGVDVAEGLRTYLNQITRLSL